MRDAGEARERPHPPRKGSAPSPAQEREKESARVLCPWPRRDAGEARERPHPPRKGSAPSPAQEREKESARVLCPWPRRDGGEARERPHPPRKGSAPSPASRGGRRKARECCAHGPGGTAVKRANALIRLARARHLLPPQVAGEGRKSAANPSGAAGGLARAASRGRVRSRACRAASCRAPAPPRPWPGRDR
ncbi:hypothetical protein SAMN05444161_3418 [Rhizobiales bacterium GAS191]|nr:hypothetical protein SAMN05444161_3418 [Rhizobiales bacterium GAS191]